MKKLFYCLLVALGFSLLATSCEKDPSGGGNASELIGTWVIYKECEDGEWYFYDDDYAECFTFYKNGKGLYFEYDPYYEEIDWSVEFKWKRNSDKLTITFLGETDYCNIVKLTDKELVVKYEAMEFIAYFKKVDDIDIDL